MNQIKSKSQLLCDQHEGVVTYIQVYEIQQNKSIFYCDYCTEKDVDFKPSNYVSIQKIQEQQDNQIICQWPPLNSIQIQQSLIDMKYQEFNMTKFQMEITSYFNDLKNSIVAQLEEMRIKVINHSLRISEIKGRIKEKYQEVSKVKEFKNIINDIYTNSAEKKVKCEEFLQRIAQEKDKNTQIFSQLFNEKEQLMFNVSIEKQKQIKKEILDYIKNTTANLLIPPPIDILSNLSFIKQNIKSQLEEYSDLKITKNIKNELNISNEISEYQSQSEYYYSNFILFREKTYIIKFQILPLTRDKSSMTFGLIGDNKKEISRNYEENNLFFKLLCDKNTIQLESKSGITQKMQGNPTQISQDTQFQLTICVQSGLFELKDIPKEKNIAVLQDQFQSRLTDPLNKDFRFYLHLTNDFNFQINSIYQI